jgi:hypothetical protein
MRKVRVLTKKALPLRGTTPWWGCVDPPAPRWHGRRTDPGTADAQTRHPTHRPDISDHESYQMLFLSLTTIVIIIVDHLYQWQGSLQYRDWFFSFSFRWSDFIASCPKATANIQTGHQWPQVESYQMPIPSPTTIVIIFVDHLYHQQGSLQYQKLKSRSNIYKRDYVIVTWLVSFFWKNMSINDIAMWDSHISIRDFT